jgi:hypothetical protein
MSWSEYRTVPCNELMVTVRLQLVTHCLQDPYTLLKIPIEKYKCRSSLLLTRVVIVSCHTAIVVLKSTAELGGGALQVCWV